MFSPSLLDINRIAILDFKSIFMLTYTYTFLIFFSFKPLIRTSQFCFIGIFRNIFDYSRDIEGVPASLIASLNFLEKLKVSL